MGAGPARISRISTGRDGGRPLEGPERTAGAKGQGSLGNAELFSWSAVDPVWVFIF